MPGARMRQWEARAAAANRLVLPDADLLAACSVLRAARAPASAATREALAQLEAQLTVRGVPLPAPTREAK